MIARRLDDFVLRLRLFVSTPLRCVHSSVSDFFFFFVDCMCVSLMITIFLVLLAVLGSPSLSITAAGQTTRGSDYWIIRRFAVTPSKREICRDSTLLDLDRPVFLRLISARSTALVRTWVFITVSRSLGPRRIRRDARSRIRADAMTRDVQRTPPAGRFAAPQSQGERLSSGEDGLRNPEQPGKDRPVGPIPNEAGGAKCFDRS